MNSPVDPVVIGRIARPVGLKGEVKVTSVSDVPERFADLSFITIEKNNNFRSLKIIYSIPKGKWTRIKLEDIDTPERAATLIGGDIVISSSERKQQTENQFYVDDLIGCLVSTDDGEEIGILREVWRQGHHDIWVVDGPLGEILVPAVREYIQSADVQDHRIVVKRVEGLWEER